MKRGTHGDCPWLLFIYRGLLMLFFRSYQRWSWTNDWKLAFALMIPSVIGGVIGAQIVAYLSNQVLKKLIGGTILILGLVLAIRKEMGIQEDKNYIENRVLILKLLILKLH